MNKNQTELHHYIINNIDIADEISKYITLSKKGQSYVCLCPFHDDSSPSMNINTTKQIFKCFVCQVGGNVINFVSKYKKINYFEAMKTIADEHNVSYENNLFNKPTQHYTQSDLQIIELLEKVNAFYKVEFKKIKNSTLKEFFTNRDLNDDILERFDIGYANENHFNILYGDEIKNNIDNFVKSGLFNLQTQNLTFKDRIMFGIRDNNGSIVGFSARSLIADIKPKYINSKDSSIFKKSEILYNYHQAKNYADNNSFILVEGFFDVIALAKCGINNSVALMGTALTSNHLKLIQNKTIIIFLDGDDAGQKATLKSAKFLLSNNIDVKIVQNHTSLDPDEILKKFGKEHLLQMINSAPDALDFIFNYYKTQHNLIAYGNNSLNNIKNFVVDFNDYIQYSDTAILNYFSNKFNDEFKFKPEFKNDNFNNYPSNFSNSQVFDNLLDLELNDIDDYYSNVNDYDLNIAENNYIINQKNTILPSFIDRLFYVIIEHPDLIKLYVESVEKNGGFKNIGTQKGQTQSKIYDILVSSLNQNLNDDNKNYIRKKSTQNGILEHEYYSFKLDLEKYPKYTQQFKDDFNDLIVKAIRENNKDYKEYITQNADIFFNNTGTQFLDIFANNIKQINKINDADFIEKINNNTANNDKNEPFKPIFDDLND
ncbi:DNA primase [Mycoplasmopsis phocirhinis]|uniref:DNA primase n=1 Tax=Mycoplasmopsis phocirhinis TaxID=142650 RepID=A0A4P6MQF2_9BACT|nr:DNA primase [Mycoplasmopsis phocirhinis]QBF34966.1 DNA primase [Mycoplasmopsis phocirhinis]